MVGRTPIKFIVGQDMVDHILRGTIHMMEVLQTTIRMAILIMSVNQAVAIMLEAILKRSMFSV